MSHYFHNKRNLFLIRRINLLVFRFQREVFCNKIQVNFSLLDELWLWRVVAGFLPRRLRFGPGPVRVAFVAGKLALALALAQVFPWVLGLSAVNIIPSRLHSHLNLQSKCVWIFTQSHARTEGGGGPSETRTVSFKNKIHPRPLWRTKTTLLHIMNLVTKHPVGWGAWGRQLGEARRQLQRVGLTSLTANWIGTTAICFSKFWSTTSCGAET
jgi:hypothetical protein